MTNTSGSDLREAREAAGVTKLDLARQLGWHRSRVWRYEREATVDPERVDDYMRGLREIAETRNGQAVA